MKIKQQHKNGQILQAVKTYDELTAEEKSKLIIPATNKLEDYANFVVHYNKNGRLIRVATGFFSDLKRAELEANRGNDLVDMFKNIEGAIANKNLSRDAAAAALKAKGFL